MKRTRWVLALLFTFGVQGSARADDGHDHRFCGWLYGSERDDAQRDLAYDTFAAHAGDFDAVHPTWWHVAGTTAIERRPAGFHDPRVLDHTTARGERTLLIPTIVAVHPEEVASVHAIINDPALAERHVAAIVELATNNGYDGLDLDYEHLDTRLDDRHTVESERRAFDGFVDAVARALHAAGKTLSLAVQVEGGPGDVYDYEALSAAADHIHVMGYDYHFEQGPHAGPVAPLSWVGDAVSYIDTIDGGRRKGKFILGLPNYGLYGPHATSCDTSRDCLALVGGRYATRTTHMQDCRMERGGAIDPGRTPNGVLPNGDTVFFEDIDSLEEKVVLAERAGLGGIAYWTIGGEPDRPAGRTFFEMVRSHFPRG